MCIGMRTRMCARMCHNMVGEGRLFRRVDGSNILIIINNNNNINNINNKGRLFRRVDGSNILVISTLVVNILVVNILVISILVIMAHSSLKLIFHRMESSCGAPASLNRMHACLYTCLYACL